MVTYWLTSKGENFLPVYDGGGTNASWTLSTMVSECGGRRGRRAYQFSPIFEMGEGE